MAEKFLISVDVESLDSKPEEGLDLRQASVFGCIFTSVKPVTFKVALHLLEQRVNHCKVYLDVTALEDLQDVIQLLDSGAQKVFLSSHQLTSILQTWHLNDLSRLVVSFQGSQIDDVKKTLQNIDGGSEVCFYSPDGSFLMRDDVPDRGSSSPLSHYTRVPPKTTQLSQYCHRAMNKGFIPIIESSRLTVTSDVSPHSLPIMSLISPLIRSDRPDGLYPTVVVNEHGICLGLVYSSKESIATAIKDGRGVYQSRNRGLWFKGETSGDIQDLIGIDWDCDGDALRFIVEQKGDGM